LEEDFKPHPSNPQYRDVRRARPAGKLFINEGLLIRPAQIGAPHYGSGIVLNEVKELSPTVFKEVEVEKIFPNWEKRIHAMHTLNREGSLTIIDIQKRRFRWF